MSDSLGRIRELLDEVANERDGLRGQKSAAEMEIHQLRRQLRRAEDGYREVNDLNAELKRQLQSAEQRVTESRRAMLDHAART